MTTTKAKATRTRKPISDADRETRDAKLADLHNTLHEQVSALRTGDQWAAWLTAAKRFHHYSFGNILLILAQYPDATQVAGYRAWQAMGRQVRKGEHAIAVLAPIVRKVDDEKGGDPVSRVVGFTTRPVFDIAQTDGDPLPEQPAAVLLARQAPAGLWDHIEAAIVAKGFTVERGDCGQANGVTRYDTKTVTVRADVDDAQAVKTLAHEYAHVALHSPDTVGLTAGVCRGVAEVEAESVAYLVTGSHGMDTGAYTFPYVTGWASGVKDTTPEDVVRQTGTRVMRAARDLLDATGQDSVEEAA